MPRRAPAAAACPSCRACEGHGVVRRLLAVLLFLFEPYLAATVLLRLAASLDTRDVPTYAALAVRVLLAIASVIAAMALGNRREGADRLASLVLTGSAAFAVLQLVTRALPTSVPPDLAPVLTSLIVVHHLAWVGFLRVSGNRQDNLSDVCRVECTVRVGNAVERKRRVHDGPHATGRQQRPDVRLERARDGGLLVDAADAKRGSRNRQALENDRPRIERRGRAAHETNHDKTPLACERRQVSFDIGPPDDVKDDVDAAAIGQVADARGKVFGAVIDGGPGAERFDGAAALVRSRRGVDVAVERRGELDRRCADAACAAVDEQRLARAQAAPLEDVGPDGEERLGDRRGFGERQSFREDRK